MIKEESISCLAFYGKRLRTHYSYRLYQQHDVGYYFIKLFKDDFLLIPK